MVNLTWVLFLPWGSWAIPQWTVCQHYNLLESLLPWRVAFLLLLIIRPLPITTDVDQKIHSRCLTVQKQKYSPVMLYWCVRDRLREQEERDIKCTVLLLSLCPRVHVPADSPVYFLPSASFGLSPAPRHRQETELPRKFLLHQQSMPHFLSSTLSFPGCLLCAACQPVAHVKRSTEVFWT